MLDASLVAKLFAHTLESWTTPTPDEQARLASEQLSQDGGEQGGAGGGFILRALLFHHYSSVPSYVQGLSWRWRGRVVFGAASHAQQDLVQRFGVTQIPSLVFIKLSVPTPSSLSSSSSSSSAAADAKATAAVSPMETHKYDGLLSFNHVDRFCEELEHTIQQQQRQQQQQQQQQQSQQPPQQPPQPQAPQPPQQQKQTQEQPQYQQARATRSHDEL